MNYLQSNTKIIKNKTGLLNLAQELGNISKACKVMGFSRDTFYRYQKAVEEGGVSALFDRTRRKPNLKNRTAPEVEEAILKLAVEEPAWGQLRVSNELRREGLFISAAGVRNVWMRNNLETMKKRLNALEEKVAKEGHILTESQLKAMEKREAGKGSTWRNRDRTSRISWFSGYLVCRDFKGSRKDLSTNLRRYLLKDVLWKALYNENTYYGSGFA